eukprot:TRINITY_DN99829_c0_g1_i1.p1 TRINITY_DN99829_c0_g1~~TRINITY_DN99829_c0_g1_i1.p1  ORF type:complete len:160 (+),score=30.91 TRINITY_DN99829_c0_g1_i1:1-480(+)
MDTAVDLFVAAGLIEQSQRKGCDYLAINEYIPPGGIESHVDEYTDSEQILILSLLEDCVMQLTWRGDIREKRKNPSATLREKNKERAEVVDESEKPTSKAPLRLLLPQASLLIMREEARWAWAHGIAFGKTHEFDEDTIVDRNKRISLTFLMHPHDQVE